VCAFNTKGEWCSSVAGAGYDHPESPTSLTGTLASGTVQLNWTNGQAPQDGVRVYRWDDAGKKWTRLGTTAASATSYTDAAPGVVRQHYHVCAVDARAESCSGVTSVGSEQPDAPTGLGGARSGNSVQLHWTNGAATQTGVHVARWDRTAHQWHQIASLPAGATSYTDTAAVGRQYYHVSGFNTKGERYSAVLSVS
jgi:titin